MNNYIPQTKQEKGFMDFINKYFSSYKDFEIIFYRDHNINSYDFIKKPDCSKAIVINFDYKIDNNITIHFGWSIDCYFGNEHNVLDYFSYSKVTDTTWHISKNKGTFTFNTKEMAFGIKCFIHDNIGYFE